MAAMTGTDGADGVGVAGVDSGGVIDLDAIRRDIDRVDVELVELLARRQRLVERVVAYKRDHHLGVVDRHREDEMLAAIAGTAKDRGADPRVAQQVLRTIIDGFTLLEVEELGPDPETTDPRPGNPPGSPR